MVIDKFEFPSGDAQFHCPSIVKHIVDSNPTHARKVSKDHIWDENQSVKWNREETERYNNEVVEINRLNLIDRQKSFENLDNAIIDWIVEDVNFCISKDKSLSRDTVKRFYNTFKLEKGSIETYEYIRFISTLLRSIIED